MGRYQKLIHIPVLSVLLAATISFPALAQQTKVAEVTAEVTVTPETIQSRIDQADARTDLDEAAKKKLTDYYKSALAELQLANQWKETSAKFDKAQQDAPAMLKALKDQLAAKPQSESRPEVSADVGLAQLEQILAQAEADLAAAQKNVVDLDAETKHRNERRTEIPKELTAARQQLDDVNSQLAAAAPTGDLPDLTQARRLQLQMRSNALQQEIRSAETELSSYNSRTELLQARQDEAARNLAQGDKKAKTLRERVNEGRRQEAEQAAKQAAEARRQAAEALPAVQDLAEGNAELANERTGLLAMIEKTTKQLEQIKSDFERVRDNFKSAKERVDTAGLTKSMAVFLRKERAELPDVRLHQKTIWSTQSKIAEVDFNRRQQLKEQRAELSDIDQRVKDFVDELRPPPGETQREDIEKTVRKLFENRRNYVDPLISDYDTYLNQLNELEQSENRLIDKTGAFASYIDENILWFRSGSPVGISDFGKAGKALRWVFSPSGWIRISRDSWLDIQANLPLYTIVVLAFVGLLIRKGKLLDTLQGEGNFTTRAATDAFQHTIKALTLTAVVALIWPGLIVFVAWRLTCPPEALDLAKAAGAGLYSAVIILLTIQMVRKTCIRGGLGDAHFKWRTQSLKRISRNLAWLMPTLFPAVFIVSTLEWENNTVWSNSLGRLAFMVGMIFVTAFTVRILRPKDGILQQAIAHDPEGWLSRFRYVWFPAAVGVPIVLTALAAVGYYYTALALTYRLLGSLWLVLGILLVYSLLVRWLFVASRQLAVEQARKRAQAAETEAKASRETKEREPSAAPEPKEPETTLFTMSKQTRQLLRSIIGVALIVGLLLIWGDILPALAILDRVQLWSQTIDGKTVPVTLAGLGLAIVIVIMTIVAAKNIPGVLEIVVLQRLRLAFGVRFAITTISRYVIILIGFSVAFNVIGIGWSKVQWLAAAITVGLGFGLQEIFANFVSGLIILFERPIRVGDTVTIGGISGTVSRIRIRATTITTWERKELIVPNKEFITGRLVNWTLSDTILRMVLPVGIAYGSDTQLAQELLLKIAHEHPAVLNEPNPIAFFHGFGDSSLNFELHVYIGSVESCLAVTHDLHMAVDREFRKAKIAISFPQRDLHLRSVDKPIPIMLDRKKENHER
jgi:potassium efflux system protein